MLDVPGDHFTALTRIFIGDRASSSSCRRVSRNDRGKKLTGSWRRNHGSSERSVKGLSYNDSRLLLIYLQFRNSSTRFDIEYFPPIRNFDPSCDPIPIEMIRRSIQRDFIYRLARRFLSIFHSYWKTFRWWKIVGRKLSRVSTHTHTYTYTYMYILRYTGLMLHYQMWNIFMVSP